MSEKKQVDDWREKEKKMFVHYLEHSEGLGEMCG